MLDPRHEVTGCKVATPHSDEKIRILESDLVEGVRWHHGHIDEDILTGYVSLWRRNYAGKS